MGSHHPSSSLKPMTRLAFLSISSIALLASATSYSAGKKPPSAPSCGNLTTPRPLRQAVVKEVGTRAFQLPNGSVVNLGSDLQMMLTTVAANSGVISPADPHDVNPCDTYLELRSAVTALQLDVVDAGISFGYNPNGELGPVTGIGGSVDVKVGTITMDFSLWQCVAGRCSAITASHATNVTAGLDAKFNIDFSAVTTSPGLIFNTPLGEVLRAVMKDALAKLAISKLMDRLPWNAEVIDYQIASGTMVMNAGMASGVGLNQTFMIYARRNQTPDSAACGVFQVVAYAHTIKIDTVTSILIVDQILDSRGVQNGDIVMVRKVDCKQ